MVVEREEDLKGRGDYQRLHWHQFSAAQHSKKFCRQKTLDIMCFKSTKRPPVMGDGETKF